MVLDAQAKLFRFMGIDVFQLGAVACYVPKVSNGEYLPGDMLCSVPFCNQQPGPY